MTRAINAVLLDFGGVVGTMRMRLLGEPGSGNHAVDLELTVIECIQRLRQEGKKAGLVTNNDRQSFETNFPEVQLERWFDAVVFSSDVGSSKPAAPIYRKALQLLNVNAEEAVFIDDLARNVDAAESLGMCGFIAASPAAAASYLKDLLAT